MTKDEATPHIPTDEKTSRPILGQFLVFFGVSFFGGGISAAVAIGLERGFDAIVFAVGGTLLVIGLIMTVIGVRIGDFEPPTLKTRAGRMQIILLTCVILGMFLGMYLNLTGAVDSIMEGTFALSRTEGIVALVILFGLGLPLGLYWQSEIDEHENAAAKDGGYIALNVYIYGYLGWVIAASADLVPAVDHFALFLIVIFTFMIAWVAKRAG